MEKIVVKKEPVDDSERNILINYDIPSTSAIKKEEFDDNDNSMNIDKDNFEESKQVEMKFEAGDEMFLDQGTDSPKEILNKEVIPKAKKATICSIHFDEKYFEIPLKQRFLNYSHKNARNLKAEAVPNLKLPGGSLDTAQKRKSNCILEAHNTETITEESELPTRVIQELRDQTELLKLRQKVKILESQNKDLLKEIEKTKLSTYQKYNTILAKVFTPGQIKTLLNSKKNLRVRWSTEDIASAISLWSVSPKAYRYLKANNYPLPAKSTLRKCSTQKLL